MVSRPVVLCVVLAGREGKRLWPLTADRAKAAVPFGGNFRLIDFVLSNLVNAGFRRICVLTQYKSHSLARHISTTWRLNQMLGNFIIPVPAQQRLGPRWYGGSADALLQTLHLIEQEQPQYLIVCTAEHLYRLDPAQVLAEHIESDAEVTVAGIRVFGSEAGGRAVIATDDADRRITGYAGAPADAPAVPGTSFGGDPGTRWVSMGVYVFTAAALIQALRQDAEDVGSAHDVDANIIPMFVRRGTTHVYDFADNQVPGSLPRDREYWREISTLDAYYAAHMDLVSVHPIFNLYNEQWPVLSAPPIWPPAKFGQNGTALDSMVGPGSIIAGATVQRCVVFDNVRIEVGAMVSGSILMSGVRIGRHAVVRNAIVDKNVVIGDGQTVGLHPEADRAVFTVTPAGITAIGKGQKVVGP